MAKLTIEIKIQIKYFLYLFFNDNMKWHNVSEVKNISRNVVHITCTFLEQAAIHGVSKSQTQLSMHTSTHTCI